MVTTKNITLSNNEEIFKLKNEIEQINTSNNITNEMLSDLGDSINILKYIYGESPQIKGEEATQIITTTPATITPTTVVTNVRNTISYTSNFAVLPFNCLLKESVGGTLSINNVNEIYITAPTNIDSTLIMYFLPMQYKFLKNTVVTIRINNISKQILFIDLRTNPQKLQFSTNFFVNSSTTDNTFDYGFAKLIFKIRKTNSFYSFDHNNALIKCQAICFISDIIKNI